MTTTCTMILGDCLEVMPTLGKNSIQMAFCDLPYGAKTTCHWDVALPMDDFFSSSRICLTKHAIMAMTSVHPFTHIIIEKKISNVKYVLVWNKNCAGAPSTARFRPLSVHEDIVIIGTSSSVFNPQMVAMDKPTYLTPGRVRHNSQSTVLGPRRKELVGRKYTHKYPTSIIYASPRNSSRGLHPTQKPASLLDWLIRTYSNAGDIVLDPTSGSGTTAVSACQTGRSVTCIEKDEGYFELSVERVRKHIRDNLLDVKLEVRK